MHRLKTDEKAQQIDQSQPMEQQQQQHQQRLVITNNEINKNSVPINNFTIKAAEADMGPVNYVNTCVVSPLIVQMNKDDEESDLEETTPIKSNAIANRRIPKERSALKSRLKPVIKEETESLKKVAKVVSIKRTGILITFVQV